MQKIYKKSVYAGVGLSFIAACSSINPPENLPSGNADGYYQAQYRPPSRMDTETPALRAPEINRQACAGPMAAPAKIATVLHGERLSRNDLVDVRVGDDETFNESYVVSSDGMLKLPFLKPIPAQGRTVEDIEGDLGKALIREGLYDTPPRLSVRVMDFSSINIAVSGAVFEPRGVEIGKRVADDIDIVRQSALGASTEARSLAWALRAAGGIRPDADLSAIELHRGGKVYKMDLRALFEGRTTSNVMLIAGDKVVVPSRGCFQENLMRPGPISPPGVSLFMSNLTQPAPGNASAAVTSESREIPYGTRFMTAVVSANCVGGSRSTSAARSAVLFTRNPMNGVSAVIERRVEEMVRRADRDDFDPYVLPGDAIACYDSTVTSVAEVAKAVGIVAGATLLVK